MVSGFAFASSALYRSQPEAGAHSFAEQINQTLLIDDSAVPNGGTRFCASRSTEACLKNVHLVFAAVTNQRARCLCYGLKSVWRETAASARGFSPAPQIVRRETNPVARAEAIVFGQCYPPPPCWCANN